MAVITGGRGHVARGTNAQAPGQQAHLGATLSAGVQGGGRTWNWEQLREKA